MLVLSYALYHKRSVDKKANNNIRLNNADDANLIMTLSANVKTLTAKYVEAGATVDDLAVLFATKPVTIRARLAKMKLKAARKTCAEFDDRNTKICQMYLKGRSLEEVGQQYNITRERVRQILVKKGISERRTKQRDKNTIKQNIVKQVMTLYLEGLTRPEAFKALGLPSSTMSNSLPVITKTQHKVHRIAWFWKSVKKQIEPHPTLGTPCWLWAGCINEITGYGHLNWFDSTVSSAHRVAYLLAKGKPSQWVLHRCDERRCVNPDHLYEGTAKENARDRDRNGHAGFKLNFQKAQTIRQRLIAGESLPDLAIEFGVCTTTIYNIQLNCSWIVDRPRSNEKLIRRAWACKGQMSAPQANKLTGVSLSYIYAIWNGWCGNDITGLPKKTSREHRITRQLILGDETHTIQGWAIILGITASALRIRLKKMSVEEALTTPHMRRRPDGNKTREYVAACNRKQN